MNNNLRGLSATEKDLIEPCIHCSTTEYLYIVRHGYQEFQVDCKACHMRGPQMPTRITAREAWNNLWD